MNSPEKIARAAAREAAWRLANPEAAKAKFRAAYERQKSNPVFQARRRAAVLRHKYGITAEDYDRMLLEQGGRCAICRTDKPGRKFFAVDHNHQTGAVRKLLCMHCNVAIGYLREDPAIARAAAEYLDSFTR